MIDTNQQPLIRMRTKHVFTAKDGWRLDETTAEVSEVAGTNPEELAEILRVLQKLAFLEGMREVDTRNLTEGRE